MNQEEKLKLAEECRKAGAFRPVDPDVLAAIAVKPERKLLPANERGVDTYIFDGTGGVKDRPLFLNFHGGGFIKGRADRDSLYCSEFADQFQCTVWDVDYVLAPEYPFPAAVYEVYDIIRYAYEHADEYGFDRDRFFLFGHSAGSNLICGALALNERNPAFRVKGIILDYIPVDQRRNPFNKLDVSEYSDERRVSRALMEYHYLELYMEPEQCIDELASPFVLPDQILEKFPDTLFVTAGQDTLREEGEEFAVRMAKLGVPITWKRFVNSAHGFTINRNGEWEAAWKLHKKFIKGLI